MLLRQHPDCQRVGRIARQHRHHRLRENGAMVEFSRHLMHRKTSDLARRIQRAPVRVQSWKSW